MHEYDAILHDAPFPNTLLLCTLYLGSCILSILAFSHGIHIDTGAGYHGSVVSHSGIVSVYGSINRRAFGVC